MEKMNVSNICLNAMNDMAPREMMSLSERLFQAQKKEREKKNQEDPEQVAVEVQNMMKAMQPLLAEKEMQTGKEGWGRKFDGGAVHGQADSTEKLPKLAAQTPLRDGLPEMAVHSDDVERDLRAESLHDAQEALMFNANVALRERAAAATSLRQETLSAQQRDKQAEAGAKSFGIGHEAGWTYNFHSWGRQHAVRILAHSTQMDSSFANTSTSLQPTSELVEQRLLDHGCRHQDDPFLSRERSEQQQQQKQKQHGRDQFQDEGEH